MLEPKYNNKIKLIYININYYVIKIEINLYKDFKEINKYMDFNNYSPEYPNYNKLNKKVLGKFKDKINGKIIIYFIKLKSKEYYYRIYGNNKEDKKIKE